MSILLSILSVLLKPILEALLPVIVANAQDKCEHGEGVTAEDEELHRRIKAAGW